MDYHVSRRAVLAGTAVGLAGCASGSDGATGTDTDTATTAEGASPSETTGAESTATASPPPTASAQLPVAYSFKEIRNHVVSGGPPKDGIPSIDDPTFVTPNGAPDWLTDDEIVFGVVAGDDVKAYPQKVLVWHEICNDMLDGTNVTVSYCPLTGTAMGFERGETTFGVSGNLVNSNLVMYDRATDSRWPQVLGTAIEGPLKGESLREFRLVWTTWGDWRAARPDTRVLSDETNYVRNYGEDPYGSYTPLKGYYARGEPMFQPMTTDDRLFSKEMVLGTRSVGRAVAFTYDPLETQGYLTEAVGGRTVLAVYDGRFDTGYVYVVDGEASVESVADGTATLGDGTTHPVDDLPFDRAYAFDAMWFAWAGFYPETKLVETA